MCPLALSFQDHVALAWNQQPSQTRNTLVTQLLVRLDWNAKFEQIPNKEVLYVTSKFNMLLLSLESQKTPWFRSSRASTAQPEPAMWRRTHVSTLFTVFSQVIRFLNTHLGWGEAIWTAGVNACICRMAAGNKYNTQMMQRAGDTACLPPCDHHTTAPSKCRQEPLAPDGESDHNPAAVPPLLLDSSQPLFFSTSPH